MSVCLREIHDRDGKRYEITQILGEYPSFDDPVVWSRSIVPEDRALCSNHFWPPDVRNKYEELKGVPEFDPEWTPEAFVAGTVGFRPNVVELIYDEQAWDQPCLYGNRCSRHAVYCHNDGWLYSPRKCYRRKEDPDFRHEDCPGFHPNPFAGLSEE